MLPSRKIKKVQMTHLRCVWGLLCRLSSIDQERNDISLFSVFDEISIFQDFFSRQTEENKPLIIGLPCEIVFLCRRTLSLEVSSEELVTDCKLKLVDPRGEILQETLSPLRFQKSMRRMRFKVRMDGLVITIPGDYVYRIEIKQPEGENFETVLEIPFEIKKLDGLPRAMSR